MIDNIFTNQKAITTLKWLPYYYFRELTRKLAKPKHVYLCICDHFEPYRNKASNRTARKRIQRWCKEYPDLAGSHLDSDGNPLQYTFFYPEEEYHQEDMAEIERICHAGFSDVEIHLHHDNDTPENLRHTLNNYKKRLHENHGLLSVDKQTGEIVYGFIHGNWALCNSRPDGRWCGINNEINILLETGCYADYTLPSAPSPTQTHKVNSIYYAQDKPGKPKSHNWGIEAEVGKPGDGLLMVQGPLSLDWGRRKFGMLPRIENSGLLSNHPPSSERVKLWIETGVSVNGAPEHVFVKLYTHGAQEDVMQMLFDSQGLKILCGSLEEYCNAEDIAWHYVTAKGMYNVIKQLEIGER